MFGRGEYDTFSVYPVLGVFSKALSLGCGCLIPTVWWKYGLFLRFFCRRAPCLRHFIGHSFGTSGKHQPVPMIGISPKTRKGNQLSLIPLGSFSLKCWSGWKDLNLRPLEPHSSALPDCATSRHADGDTFLMPRCQQLFAGSVNFFWLRDASLFVSIFISTD